jgi:hypothetical protein
MPVKDPVRIKYTGPVMFHRAYVGPSGKAYYAEPEQVISVERADFEAMVALPNWEKPPRVAKRRAAVTATPGEEA